MPNKNPAYYDKIILKDGGVIEREDGTDIVAISDDGSTTTITGTETVNPSEIPLSNGYFIVGNSSDVGVATAPTGLITPTMISGQANADDSAQLFTPQVLRWSWSNDDPDGNNDIVLYNAASPAVTIIDAYLDMTTAEGGAMTVTLRDATSGGGNAITSAMDANTTGISRTTSLASNTLAANSSLVANFSGDPGTAVGVLYVVFVRNA